MITNDHFSSTLGLCENEWYNYVYVIAEIIYLLSLVIVRIRTRSIIPSNDAALFERKCSTGVTKIMVLPKSGPRTEIC